MLQNFEIHHNLWNKPSGTPILRQSAFPIHDTRQFVDLIYNGNKLRKHSCLFHGQLTEKFSSNFQNKKNPFHMWITENSWLTQKIPDMQLGYHCTCKCKLSGCSLPCDNVNQLEMEAISQRLNICITHQNLAT